MAGGDLTAVEVDVFDAKLTCLQKSQPRAVQQAGEQAVLPTELAEHLANLFFREHHRNTFRSAGTRQTIEPVIAATILWVAQ